MMRLAGSGAILNLHSTPVRAAPFEHVMVEGFINQPFYDEIVRTFPECPPSTGPTGYSIYWGDREYDDLITHQSAWRALFQATHSQDFVNYCIALFRPTYAKAGCLIDLDSARYVPYQESREDKERRYIFRPQHAPNELWVRLDIHQGHVGYCRVPHVDHRRRLVSMLIYLCDAQENSMRGGALVLHGSRKHWWEFGSADSVHVLPGHNRMVGFPCHASSSHSVPAIIEQSAPRNFLQIAVSSSVDAWPSDVPRPARRLWSVSRQAGTPTIRTRRSNNEENMTRVGLLFVATGRYTQFFPRVFKEAEENFLKEFPKKYFVFTDDPEFFNEYPSDKVIINRIERKGFPGDTLYRYHHFLLAEEQIKAKADVVYYLDVDMSIPSEVGEEVLPSEATPYIGVAHPGFWNNRTPNCPLGTPEHRKESTAFIGPRETRPCYWAGGFNGGKSFEYIEMAKVIKKNIDKDGMKNLVAVWHDESHLNRYFVYVQDMVKTMLPSYCYPESCDLGHGLPRKIVALDKDHEEIRKSRP